MRFPDSTGKKDQLRHNFTKKRLAAVIINLIIAFIHLMGPGRYLRGNLQKFYCSFFSDIIIPFGFYFLLCAAEFSIPWLKGWKTKLLISVLIPSIAETLQFVGINLLGSTFDWLDYLMYASGATSAAAVENLFFKSPSRSVELKIN